MERFAMWVHDNKEIVIAFIGASGGVAAGWLTKGGKDKFVKGYQAAKDRSCELGMKGHSDKLDTLEDRVASLEGHYKAKEEHSARLLSLEEKVSAMVQNISDCQLSRDTTLDRFEKLLCFKIGELEKRLLERMEQNGAAPSVIVG